MAEWGSRAGGEGPAPGRGRRGAAPHVCEPGGWWRACPCGSARGAALVGRLWPPPQVTTAALLRPEPSAFFAAPPAPQAPGKCAALRRGPRPPERRAAGEGGRPWSQRAPLRVSPPPAPLTHSPISAPRCRILDPRPLIPDPYSRIPALRPHPCRSLGGAASRSLYWPRRCGLEPSFPSPSVLCGASGAPQTVRKANRPFPGPAQRSQIARPACTGPSLVLGTGLRCFTCWTGLGGRCSSHPGEAIRLTSGFFLQPLLGDCAGCLGPYHRLSSERTLK